MIEQNQYFISPTYGKLDINEVFTKITQFIEREKDRNYVFIVGTDSFTDINLNLVTAIIVHKVGSGAIYFYRKKEAPKVFSLKQKVLYEATMSLEVASMVAYHLSKNGLSEIRLEIHLDVGGSTETKDIIKDVVSMVLGNGFLAVVKPGAFGASNVADRHTK